MEREQVTRRMAAILAADVAGYSRLMGLDEEDTLARLKAHRRELVDPKIAEHHGRIVKTTGDGMLVEFASVMEAVRCAVDFQRGMADRNAEVPPDRRIEFRVGINLGDVIIDGDDVYGDGVNIAARLEGLAEPNGVCMSRSVRDQVRDKLHLIFEDMGEQQVKNITRPVRVFRIAAPDTGQPMASTKPALALPDKPSIAVLPFTNLNRDPEQEYFADGIVEEIITALSRVKAFFVIARNSTFTYKGRAVDVRQVGRELGVRYVLEGSVRKSGDRVRISGQLVEASSGQHLWADRFDGAFVDLFDLQDQIAASVIGAIGPTLQFAEIDRARNKPTADLNAYDLFLRALHRYYAMSREASDEALLLLKRAIAIDPDYTLAKALASFCYQLRLFNLWSERPDADRQEGTRLAREALAAHRDDPSALRLAGNALAYHAHDFSEALAAIDRSLALNVNSSQALGSSGYVRCFVSDWNTAIDHFNRAVRLSPLDPEMGYFMSGLSLAHLIAGDHERALGYAHRAVQEMPRLAVGHRCLIMGLVHLDRIEEARRAMRSMLDLHPGQSIARWRAVVPYRDEAFVARFMDALRRAGMPEE